MEECRAAGDIRELEEQLARLKSTVTQLQKLEGKIDQLVTHLGLMWKPCPKSRTGDCEDGREFYGPPCDVCRGAGVVLGSAVTS